MARIGPELFGELPIVASAPGHRLRTRLHAARGTLGYFAPGTHRLDARRGLRGDCGADTGAPAGDRGGDPRKPGRGQRGRLARGHRGRPSPPPRDRLGGAASGRRARRVPRVGTSRASSLRGPDGALLVRRGEDAWRFRRGPRLSRVRRHVLPGESASGRPALRGRPPRRRGSRRRATRSTPSAAWASSPGRFSMPGTASTSVESEAGAAADAASTRRGLGRSRAMRDRGFRRRRVPRARRQALLLRRRRPAARGARGRARRASSPAAPNADSSTCPAIRRRSRGTSPPSWPRASPSGTPGSSISSRSRTAWRPWSPSSAWRDPPRPRRRPGAGGEGGGLARVRDPPRGVVGPGAPRRRARSRRSRRPGSPSWHSGGVVWHGALAFGAFWLAAGFVSGAVRIAEPARAAARTFAALSASRLGARCRRGPPRGLLERAAAARADDAGGRAARGRGPPGGDSRPRSPYSCRGRPRSKLRPDRGDRVRVTGRLEPEDLPASERELALPWPRFRLSVKSARMVEREGAHPALGADLAQSGAPRVAAVGARRRRLRAGRPRAAGGAAARADLGARSRHGRPLSAGRPVSPARRLRAARRARGRAGALRPLARGSRGQDARR